MGRLSLLKLNLKRRDEKKIKIFFLKKGEMGQKE